MHGDFHWVCPSCRHELTRAGHDFVCEAESLRFSTHHDIPDFILPSRRPEIDEFLRIYQEVRRSEQWGSDAIECYLRLPYEDLTGKHQWIWNIRRKTYECFLTDFRQHAGSRSLTVADLGAGSCWLSHRLAKEGHHVLAVDINTDIHDGLGVLSRFPSLKNFQPIRAEFNFLPLTFASCDVMIFNSSLHYSNKPIELITRTLPFLKDGGILYVLDSPMYNRPESGEIMISQKIESFRKNHGIELPPKHAGSYLTFEDLSNVGDALELTVLKPNYGIQWHGRRFMSRIFLGRESAIFVVLKIRKRK